MGLIARLFGKASETPPSLDVETLRAHVRVFAMTELAIDRANDQSLKSTRDARFNIKLRDAQDRVLTRLFNERSEELDADACTSILAAKSAHPEYLVRKALASPEKITTRDLDDIATYFDIFHTLKIHKDGFTPALAIFRRSHRLFTVSARHLNEHDREWGRAVMAVIAYFTAAHVNNTITKIERTQADDTLIGDLDKDIIDLLRDDPSFAQQIVRIATDRSLTLKTLDAELLSSIKDNASEALSEGVL